MASSPGVAAEDGLSPSARTRAISAYREHLARFPDSPEYDDVSRRLADLLLEHAAELELAMASRPAEAAALARESRQARREAISLYETLLEQSPADQELLYQLSRAYEQNGQPELAVDAIHRLIAQPPSGDPQLVSDTLFRQGELQFSLGEYAQAERSYRAVVRLGSEVPAYGQSLYKLGWSLYRQERYRAALVEFFAFLDTYIDAASPYPPQLAGLSLADREQVGELFAIISQCFALLGGVDVVTDFLALREPAGYEVAVYQALADWYESRDRVSEAAGTWLVLARRAPLADEAPTWSARAIRLYRQHDFQHKLREAQQAFLADFGPRSGFWASRQRTDYRDVMREMERSLLELADDYHQQSRLAPGSGVGVTAEQYYRDYLAWFDRSERADRVRFQLAELLYDQARYREAYAQFSRTAWSPAEGTPLAAEAALGALHATDALIERGDSADVAPLENRALEDAIRFVHYYPAHEAAPRLLARGGGVLLRQQEYSRLAQLVDPLLADAGSTPDALRQVAYTLRAQAATARGDYRAAVPAYRSALVLTADDDERRPALRSGLAIALLATARDAADRGDWDAAVAGFEEAASLPVEDPLRAAADFDLASALIALERWPEAVAVLERYLGRYPSDARQREVTRKLAFAYEQGGDLESAAREYLSIGRDTGRQPALRRQALLHSVELFRQAGRLSSAVEAGEYAVQHFREPVNQSIPLMRELALIELERGNRARQRAWLQAIVDLDSASGDDSTRPIAAESALQLAEYRMAAFRQVRLVSPLERNLARKIEAMERALRDFEIAVDYNIAAITSAANYHMARMYDELGQALLASERPRSLSASELAEYELLLAEQAAPFAEQAIEIYRLNAGRADARRADPWIDKSLEQLQRLQTGRGQPGGA
jgi:TolA-binding protein